MTLTGRKLTLKVGLVLHREIGVWILGKSERKPTAAVVLVAGKLRQEDEANEETESAILFYFPVIQTTHQVFYLYFYFLIN